MIKNPFDVGVLIFLPFTLVTDYTCNTVYKQVESKLKV
jgi:hypothetical protein